MPFVSINATSYRKNSFCQKTVKKQKIFKNNNGDQKIFTDYAKKELDLNVCEDKFKFNLNF